MLSFQQNNGHRTPASDLRVSFTHVWRLLRSLEFSFVDDLGRHVGDTTLAEEFQSQ